MFKDKKRTFTILLFIYFFIFGLSNTIQTCYYTVAFGQPYQCVAEAGQSSSFDVFVSEQLQHTHTLLHPADVKLQTSSYARWLPANC